MKDSVFSGVSCVPNDLVTTLFCDDMGERMGEITENAVFRGGVKGEDAGNITKDVGKSLEMFGC